MQMLEHTIDPNADVDGFVSSKAEHMVVSR